jgi:hypothetical protein
MNTKRGGIRFVKPPEITAAGGLCAPVSGVYALPTANERPIRDSWMRGMELDMQRAALSPVERIAFDIRHRGYHSHGRPDVAARVAEWGDEDEDTTPFYDHEWDEPIRLQYAWRNR